MTGLPTPQMIPPRIAPAELEAWAAAACERAGMTTAEARVTARVLVEADLRGVFSHGVVRLPDYCQLVTDRVWEVGAELRELGRSGATALLDGGNGVGPYQAMRAMELALEIARTSGVGWVWMRNAGHFGPAAAYTLHATRAGFIGLALTNSSPAMAAFGGWRPVLGANPWSIAVPRGADRWPLVLDIANTIVARGRVKNAARRGETLPAGWALDSAGQPTTDPAAAAAGSLAPFGGHKGYAIAFMVEALTGALAGAAMSIEVQPPVPGVASHQGVGQLFAAINPAVAIPAEEMETRLDLLIAYMRGSGDGEQAQRILAPGEREARVAEEQARRGVALPDEVRAKVGEWAERIGLDPPTGRQPDDDEGEEAVDEAQPH